jgi:hypothetical protein
MTAGSVAVPTIVPLRPPGSDLRKNVVDYTVKFELASGMNTLSKLSFSCRYILTYSITISVVV